MAKFNGQIEISLGYDITEQIPTYEGENVWYTEDTYTEFFHEGFYNSIDKAIAALQYLKEHINELSED